MGKHQLTSRKMKTKMRNRAIMNRRARNARRSKENENSSSLFAPPKNDENLTQNNVAKAFFNTSNLKIEKEEKSNNAVSAVEWTTVEKPEIKLSGVSNASEGTSNLSVRPTKLHNENEESEFLIKIAEKVEKEIRLDQKINPFNPGSIPSPGEITLAWKNISMNISEKTVLTNVC